MSLVEVETVDNAVYAGLHVYLRRAAERTEEQDLIARDAFTEGCRYGWRKGYRQSARDTAAIGEAIPVMRRLADVLEEEASHVDV